MLESRFVFLFKHESWWHRGAYAALNHPPSYPPASRPSRTCPAPPSPTRGYPSTHLGVSMVWSYGGMASINGHRTRVALRTFTAVLARGQRRCPLALLAFTGQRRHTLRVKSAFSMRGSTASARVSCWLARLHRSKCARSGKRRRRRDIRRKACSIVWSYGGSINIDQRTPCACRTAHLHWPFWRVASALRCP